ncbi:cytochrome c3 family protein [bacterium]|nr:cytochrome c3 family protein [bacterium]
MEIYAAGIVGNGLSALLEIEAEEEAAAVGHAPMNGFPMDIVAVVRGKPVRQPVEYNHSLHIENEMVCVDCHKFVETQARATIPNIETCVECHDPEEPLIDPEIAETDEERRIAEGTGLPPNGRRNLRRA